LTYAAAWTERPHWEARLALIFHRAGARSVLAERRHAGPLVVQKTLYPEGPEICHAAIVHAPGGVAGGDTLSIDVALKPAARVLLTTPAATKWYKADGRESRQGTRFAVAAGAVLESLPQEAILYDAAEARIETTVTLADDSVFAGWEILCLGRRASGEIFASGGLRQTLTIHRSGRMIWNDRLALAAGDALMRSPVGLGGCHVFGAMVVAAGPTPPELLEACRGAAPLGGQAGVTALPQILSARYVGGSAEQARNYFESLREILRPWYADRAAQRPRLWAT
jgi:urease accessory protein